MLKKSRELIFVNLFALSFSVCYYNSQIRLSYLRHIFECRTYWFRVTITSCILLTWLEHKLKTRVYTFLAYNTHNIRIRRDFEIGDICIIWYRNPRRNLQDEFNFPSRRSKIVTALHEILTKICVFSQKCSLCKTQFVRCLKTCIWQNTNNSFIHKWHGRIYQYV